jgi:hypothetical protein
VRETGRFAGYIEQMITRDVPAVAPRRDPELLRRYLSVLAVNTAGIAAESTLWSAAGINAKTAQAYQSLFQRMFILDLVPAWFSNPALVTAVLGLGRDAILYGQRPHRRRAGIRALVIAGRALGGYPLGKGAREGVRGQAPRSVRTK